MKLLKKILLILVIGFTLLFVASSIFIAFNGKAMITRQIEDFTGRKTNIGSLGMSLPFNLSIRNLDIGNLLKVEHISISPSILSLFSGVVVLDNLEIIRPYLVYEKPLPKTAELPTAFMLVSAEKTVETAVLPAPEAAGKTNKPLRLIIRHLSIRNGKIDFIDSPAGNEKIKIAITDVNFNLSNLYLFPQSALSKFKLRGKIPWHSQKEAGSITAEGWMDLSRKDMEATLKISGIDGVYLYPYYAAWVDLEKSRIESAKLNFESKIKSVNNDLAADCHIELSDIVFKPRADGEEADKAEKITKVVLDIFKILNQNKVIFNFTIRTKMDKLRFSFNDIKEAFEVRLAEGIKSRQISAEDIALVPARIVGGTVKGTGEVSLALLDGVFSLGKELAKAAAYAFDRKNNKK